MSLTVNLAPARSLTQPPADSALAGSALAGGALAVFVDPSGRRRRRVRLIGYGFSVACVIQLVLLIFVLGQPVSPTPAGRSGPAPAEPGRPGSGSGPWAPAQIAPAPSAQPVSGT